MPRAQLFQNFHRRRTRLWPSALRCRFQVQFIEQNLRQLVRRIAIELHSRQFPNFLFQAPHFFFHRQRHRRKRLLVHAHAGALHLHQHPGQWQIYFFVSRLKIFFFHLCPQCRRQSLHRIRAFSRASAQRHIELPEHHVFKIVLRSSGPQQVRIELRRIGNVFGPPHH